MSRTFALEIAQLFHLANAAVLESSYRDLAFAKKAVERDSTVRFTCSVNGCGINGPVWRMRNVDRRAMNGVIVPICRQHERELHQRHIIDTFDLKTSILRTIRGFTRSVPTVMQVAFDDALDRLHMTMAEVLTNLRRGKPLSPREKSFLGVDMAVAVEVIDEELLPPGEWPVHRAGAGSSPRICLKGGDPERIRFLQQLRALVRVVLFKGFATHRVYTGFEVLTRSGQLLILVECSERNNALYVFDGRSEWLDVARRPKHEVLCSQHAAFVRRVFHTGTWKERTLELIEA